MPLKPWKVKASRYVVSDKWIRVRADECETHDGVDVSPYYVLEYPDWVNVAAFDEEGRILLIRQYRHGTASVAIEIPSGATDPSDTTAEAAARRELLEETGCEAQEMVELGRFTPNSATHTNDYHAFMALGCRVTQAPSMDESESIVCEWKTVEDVLAMIDDGSFRQGIQVSTVLLALRRLGRLT